MERIGGWGVGGPSRELVARAKVLKLGPVEIPGPITGLSTATKGAFAMPDVAGNVGAGVLSRFTLILDYGRQQLILEKNDRFDRQDAADKSGLWLHLGDGAWEIVEVVPGTPAAEAGLQAGERILAVDGKTPSSLALSELRRRLREEPSGSTLSLRMGGPPGAERTVRLVLRDLI
jgi:membrane-associated protease RseP (regulator of RpoE activity)